MFFSDISRVYFNVVSTKCMNKVVIFKINGKVFQEFGVWKFQNFQSKKQQCGFFRLVFFKHIFIDFIQFFLIGAPCVLRTFIQIDLVILFFFKYINFKHGSSCLVQI